MSKKKARYLVLLAAVLIAVMAFSFFVLAGNELTILYLDDDGTVVKKTSATLDNEILVDNEIAYTLETKIIGNTPQKYGHTFIGWIAEDWPGLPGEGDDPLEYTDPPIPIGLLNAAPSDGPADTLVSTVTLPSENPTENPSLTFEDLRDRGYIHANTLVFRAQFEAIERTVSLYSDGELANIPNNTFANVPFGQVVNSPNGLPALDNESGRIFVGWRDADGVVYGLNNENKIIYTLNKDEDVILHAVWVNTMGNLVQFKDQDTGHIYAFFYAEDSQEHVAPIDIPNKEGHTFADEWVNAANGTDSLVAGSAINFDANKIYYPKWTINNYQIRSREVDTQIVGLAADADFNTEVSFTVEPIGTDKVIDQVKVYLGVEAGGTEVPLTDNGGGSYSFLMPASEVFVLASAKQSVFSIGQEAINATIATPDTGTAGQIVTFDVTPNPLTNNIDNVYVTKPNADGTGTLFVPITFFTSDSQTKTNTYGFTMPEANVTIHASSQAEKVTVTLLDWRGIVKEQISVAKGSDFDIKAKTDALPERIGYTFDGWFEGTNQIARPNDTTINIQRNMILLPTYIANQQDVYKGSDSSEQIEILNAMSSTSSGAATSANLLSTEPPNDRCVSATGNSVTFKVKPKFNYQITGVAVRAKDPSSNTAIGLTLKSYVEDANGTGEYSYTFNMPAEDVVIAVYTKPIPYRVFVEETALPEGGTYTINGFYSDNLAVKQGEDATINIMPKPGYEVSKIVARYTAVGGGAAYLYNTKGEPTPDPIVNSFTFVMPPADVDVTIEYKKIDYIIDTVTSNNNTYPNSAGVNEGRVETSFEGAVTDTANVDDLISLKVYPAEGYHLDALTVRLANQGQPGAMINLNVGDVANDYEFTMPASDVIVTATFVENKYNVTFRILDWNGNYLPYSIQNIDYLSTPEMPADAPKLTGYDFIGWTSNDTKDAGDQDYPSTNRDDFVIVQDTVITAVYEAANFEITYNDPDNGTVSGPDNGDFRETIAFAVTPEPGYMIDTVTAYYTDAYGQPTQLTRFNEEPDKVTGGEYKFTMPLSDVEIYVTFKEIVYNVDLYNVEGLGNVYLNGYDRDNMTAKYLEEVTITALPAPGWVLQSITVTEGAEDGAALALTPATIDPAGGAYQFTMPNDDVFISVVFVQDTYTVSFDPVVNGLVNGVTDPADVDVAYQTTATFSVEPDDGYQIASAVATYTDTNGVEQTVSFASTPDNIIDGGDYTFTMPAADVHVKVLFEEITYDVTLDDNGNAEIYLNDKIQTATRAPYLSTVTLDITPDTGWILAELYVEGAAAAINEPIVATGGTYTFTMPKEDVTVVVRTVQDGFTVTYTPPAAGTGTVSGDTAADYQDTVEFTATPASGYMIDSAVATFKDVNGQGQTITFDSVPSDLVAGGDYTFTMPAADVVVTVTFKKMTYNVALTTTGNAEILLNDTHEISTTADYNSTVTLDITPDEGWLLDSISASNGDDVYAVSPAINSEGGTYSFTMPANDVAVNVKLVKMNSSIDTFTISFTGPEHGTVSVHTDAGLDAKDADFGDIVTVVCDPDEGYKFKSLSIKRTDDGSFISPAFVSANEEYVHTYSFKMPASDVEITAAFELYSSTRYTDVRTDDWSYTAVEFVSDRGYFKGISATLFGPNKNMTRGMFVTVLGRMAEVDTSLYATATFTDVNMAAYYGPYVEWAAQEGIVLGYGKGLFGPEDNVTREQMAQIMYNYAAWAGFPVEQQNPVWMDRYTDADKISPFAQDAMEWAVGIGLMKGKSATTLNPLELATRAEVAQIIQNFSDKVVNR